MSKSVHELLAELTNKLQDIDEEREGQGPLFPSAWNILVEAGQYLASNGWVLNPDSSRWEKGPYLALKIEAAFDRLMTWSEAYPLEVFPEPDFKKVREVLESNDLSLSLISASNMRHVITKVREILEEALK